MPVSRVLITAFEAFGGETQNPSLEIAQGLRPTRKVKLEVIALPVVFDLCLRVLAERVASFNPDLVIALGQAGGRSMLSLERVAINVNDARIPDNQGQQPIDSCVIEGAPDAYFSRLPLKRMLKALHDEGIPAHISNTAGTYVCNHLMFGLLDLISTRYPKVKGGFIHVPFLPEQAIRHGAPSMSLETMTRGIELCLQACLENAPEPVLAAGETH
ncbi:MAG: pyroglutamyl-peptidase I [Trueperaceae bacterium]|nr:pyroglutamyl-peptidase I [Trueperaceae bacterium]